MNIYQKAGYLFAFLSFSVVYAETPPSLDTFIKSLNTYDCSSDPQKLAHYLAIEEPHQPQMQPQIIYPDHIENAAILWKTDEQALASMTARPNTHSTPTETGLLLALEYSGNIWYIKDKIRFSAVGKDADIQFKFTGGGHLPLPVVTVTTINGGRGTWYSVSASYELLKERLIRKDP